VLLVYLTVEQNPKYIW